MKIRTIIFAILLIPGLWIKASGDLSNAEAMFIYNFLRHIEWPDGSNNNSFIIGVYGNSPTFDQLVEFTKNRKVGTKSIEVKKISSVAEVAHCQLVFVPHNQSSRISEMKNIIGNKGCLIVGEKEGSNVLGSTIEFVIQDNRLKFRVNESNARQQNLMVSKTLLDMSIQ